MSAQADLLDSVLGKTATLIAATPPDAAARATPCPEFDVEGLVNHLAQWLTTFATSLGDDPPPTPGAPTQGWPAIEAEQFTLAAQQAVTALREGAEDRSITLMGGPIPGSVVLGMMLMEYVGHGWDLAVATGQPVPFGEAEAQAALTAGHQLLTPQYRGPDKSFGEEVPVPDDAPAVDRLIGFLGRGPVRSGVVVSEFGSLADGPLPDGPWVDCSWCDATILLSRFGVTEEEPGAQVAVCGSCHRRVFITPPLHPSGG